MINMINEVQNVVECVRTYTQSAKDPASPRSAAAAPGTLAPDKISCEKKDHKIRVDKQKKHRVLITRLRYLET